MSFEQSRTFHTTPTDSWREMVRSFLSSNTTLTSVPVVGICVLVLIISLLFHRQSGFKRGPNKDGSRDVPAVPYYIPILGHIPNMVFDANGFLKSLRQSSTDGIFALNFLGARHNVMCTPGLASALFSQKTSHIESKSVGDHLMRKVFGFPAEERDRYDAALHELEGCYKHLTSEPYLGNLASDVARNIKEHATNLVTFMESPVDQMAWEKSAGVELVQDGQNRKVVEASLLPLIRDFCATLATQTLFGSDLISNYPEILEDMWKLDSGFFLLATGLPRWTPIPGLARAHIARRRLLDKFEAYHQALEMFYTGGDPGSKWSGLNDVGSLIKARLPVYQKYNFSMRARAVAEECLLWAANANSNTLVFWMVNRIYEDKAILDKIRKEIAPYVQVSKPEANGLPILEPMRLTKLERDGLVQHCPLLKSIYIESLRIDTASWSLKVVKQDTLLQSREKGAQPWLLRKGDYVHAAHDLHNTDPKYFPDPMVYRADRHIKYDDDKKESTADMGSIRPYGGGTSMCKGRQLALQEVMLFTAAIVALWDIEAAGGGEWTLPNHKRATGVYTSDTDTRVWLKPRE